jgi:predicted dienelactone hydrolase
MRSHFRFISFAVLLLALPDAVASAQAAGLRHLQIPADPAGPRIEAVMWTPCALPPKDIAIDPPIVVPGTMNCPAAGKNLPLIVISHGAGAGPVMHHDTAEALADAGFVVVALHHPNDGTGLDNSWMIQRPVDVRRSLDFMLHASPVRSLIDPSRIGFFGFSRGGYTGLVLAGGVPHFSMFLRSRQQLSLWLFHRGQPTPQIESDSRLKAFVIVDPFVLSFFDDKQGMQKVRAPIQLWSSQKGGAGVTPEDIARVARDLPAKPEFHMVPRSDHISFGMPCTAAVAKVAAKFCADPPGFNRAAFHRQFNARVLAFYRQSLSD